MAIEIMLNNPYTFGAFDTHIWISNKIDASERLIYHFDPSTGMISWDSLHLNEVAPVAEQMQPSFRVHTELLPELARAINGHLGGTDDQREMRKLLDRESGRVDKLLDRMLAAGEINAYNVQKFIDTIRESQGMR